jgi:hypothetical protein
MQDGGSPHITEENMNWLYARCKVLPLWLANSLDLSLIEGFLGIMKRLLKWQRIKDRKELKMVLFEMWDGFELGMITSLLNSFPKRPQLCLNVGGESIQPWVCAHRFKVYGPPLGYPRRPPTDDEDRILPMHWNQLRNRWTEIARFLGDRTPAWVRNRVQYLRNLDRLHRQEQQQRTPGQSLTPLLSIFTLLRDEARREPYFNGMDLRFPQIRRRP